MPLLTYKCPMSKANQGEIMRCVPLATFHFSCDVNDDEFGFPDQRFIKAVGPHIIARADRVALDNYTTTALFQFFTGYVWPEW